MECGGLMKMKATTLLKTKPSTMRNKSHHAPCSGPICMPNRKKYVPPSPPHLISAPASDASAICADFFEKYESVDH
eukprot:14774503-Ditylum_brightwellii.AAC.1